ADAAQIAMRIANSPPIARDGATLRLRPPSDATAQRAVTVNYDVRVPANIDVVIQSDSGAVAVDGVRGAVDVRTQSAAIELHRLGGMVSVRSGSGAITAEEIGGALSATTASSAFDGRGLDGAVNVRTASGQVDLALTGSGSVDVATGSSAVRVA